MDPLYQHCGRFEHFTGRREFLKKAGAGFGALAVLRSSFMKVRVNETDLSIGPSFVLDILLAATDRVLQLMAEPAPASSPACAAGGGASLPSAAVPGDRPPAGAAARRAQPRGTHRGRLLGCRDRCAARRGGAVCGSHLNSVTLGRYRHERDSTTDRPAPFGRRRPARLPTR